MQSISSKLGDILASCRTIHKFSDRPVEGEIIVKALQNSLLAPNHKFTFPWKFYWAGPETKANLIDLATQIKTFKFGELDEEEKLKIQQKFNYPELIAFVQKKNDDPFISKEDYASLSCSVQLFALTLAELGVGYKWGTGKITRHPQAYRFFGIDQDKEEIIGFIFAGYPARPAGPRRRPQLSQVLINTK